MRKEKRLKNASQQLLPTRHTLEKKGVLDTLERKLGLLVNLLQRQLLHIEMETTAGPHLQLLVEGLLVQRLPPFHVDGFVVGYIT